jgi:hypothetical protein
MLTRHQALRQRERAFNFPLLFPILSIILLAPPLSDPARQFGLFVLLLAILSTVTLLVWRHHRRDSTSPRRIGRRI